MYTRLEGKLIFLTKNRISIHSSDRGSPKVPINHIAAFKHIAQETGLRIFRGKTPRPEWSLSFYTGHATTQGSTGTASRQNLLKYFEEVEALCY